MRGATIAARLPPEIETRLEELVRKAGHTKTFYVRGYPSAPGRPGEREVRRGMAREQLDRLPLYPEERECRTPSTERILDLFAPLQRYRLRRKGRLVQIFEPGLTDGMARYRVREVRKVGNPSLLFAL